MIDGIPVMDAVIHAYDWTKPNYANKHAEMLVEMVSEATYAGSMPGYRLPREWWASDWSMEETANLCFVESDVDLAVHHVLPIRAFKDGSCSLEKTVEAAKRWPDRFVTYMGTDPMEGKGALEDMDRQMELLGDPVGLKLYPNSWVGDQISGWLMDDPEVAFPCFEKARELGLKVVAIHKAVPLGPVQMEHYKMDDIDRAAMEFPDLNFEVVHGGMAFLEESAWQLARFPNVYLNLEITTALVARKPRAFAQAMAALLMEPSSIDKIVWGTGAMAFHPRPHLEAFVREFEFDQQLVDDFELPQFTPEVKRKVLWENYAAMTGLDLDSRLERIKGDQFAELRGDGDPQPPYSTTAAAGHAE
jgi:predicted TIM-barrel fold metal-dependent hydrolase